MRVRKVAKQLKLFHRNCHWDAKTDTCHVGYKIANHNAKQAYIMRMTKKHYFGHAKKHSPNSMMGKLYIHKACSPYLYEEILRFWGYDIYE